MYLCGGTLMDEDGGLPFDNHFGAVYSLMSIVAMVLMTYGFIQFCKNRR